MPSRTNIAAQNTNRRIRTTVKGYHYPLAATGPFLRSFGAVAETNLSDIVPKIETATIFANPNDSPVHSTIISVDHRRYLIVGYFDLLLPQNLSVKEVFPHLPWYGELAVFSLGRRTRILSRPAGGRYIVAKAVSLYVRAVIEMRVAGFEAPFQLTYPSTFGL